MEFKKVDTIFTDNFWYDLFYGGYIKPEKILKNKRDIKKINDAVEILVRFRIESIESCVVDIC